jgi:hypothetical protein
MMDEEDKTRLMEVVERLDYFQGSEVVKLARAVERGQIRPHYLAPPEKGVYLVLPIDPRLLFFTRSGYERDWVQFVRVSLGIILSLAILGTVIGVPLYYSASRSAQIYNSMNGTHYTAGDFMWAGDQINASTHTVHLK